MNRYLPERRSNAEGHAEALATGAVAALPVVGPFLGELFARQLRKAAEAQLHQFLEEMKYGLERAEERIGNLDLEVFLARREASAAFNAASDVAAKTASREKHRILAGAFINVACDVSHQFDDLSGLFWSMIDRHSVTEIRLLAAYDDPINRAKVAGVERAPSRLYGDYLLASVPELAWDFPRFTQDLTAKPGDETPDEDDEEQGDRPYWLYEVYSKQLRSDGLIEDESIPLDSELHFGDEDGSEIDYDPKPFGHATPLGEEYLRFLDLRDDVPKTRSQ